MEHHKSGDCIILNTYVYNARLHKESLDHLNGLNDKKALVVLVLTSQYMLGNWLLYIQIHYIIHCAVPKSVDGYGFIYYKYLMRCFNY